MVLHLLQKLTNFMSFEMSSKYFQLTRHKIRAQLKSNLEI